MKLAIALVLGLVPLAAQAEIDLVTQRYTCERGVEIPVAYVRAEGSTVVVLTVEGRQIALYQDISASGTRYAWPSDGAGYVWWTKGDGATLLWKDGAAGTETVLLSDCKVAP